MRNSEKGFTYPLTLCVLIIFLLFFSLQVEQLLTEKKMVHETFIILQQEYYALSSVKKVEMLYQSTGTPPAKGTFVFKNGSMEFKMETPNGNVQKVIFTLRLNTGEIITEYGFFDTSSKRLQKWLERN